MFSLKYPFIFRRDDKSEQMTEAQLGFTTLPLSNYIPGLFGSKLYLDSIRLHGIDSRTRSWDNGLLTIALCRI